MIDAKDYEYELFLSWTGADRQLKNSIKQYFKDKYGEDFRIYDSDVDCKGEFRDNFAKALYKSKVYLIILTDSLRRTEHITEVTRECDMACDLEASGNLNIVTLCLSPFFLSSQSKNPGDHLGWYFYSALSGHSKIPGEYEGDTLTANTFEKLDKDITGFIRERDEGHPAIPQKPRFDVQASALPSDDKFKGRKDQIDDIFKAFEGGARMVVLSGIGGIGKTKLAEAFAREAEQANFFRCLQIVHVRELMQERDGLKILVSEVTYENTFYQDISRLNQTEQYNSKLNVLKELPEYVLLVFDNFNTANPFALKEIVDSLKCRILVTTRASISDDEVDSQVKVFEVPTLPQETAYEIFSETSGREISFEEFGDLYINKIDRHTITLCIIAKILYAHPDLSLEELLDSMTDFNNLPQTVEFEHNSGFGGTNREDTILGHLQNLFNLTNLSGECKAVLGNISLLSDGRISNADIRKVMGLKTDNSINTLVRNGWIEQYSEGGQRYIYLHPIISQLAFYNVKPTQETASGMVEYLCGLYDDMYNKLVYSDAHIMEDKLFYCIYRLAITDRRLNGDLWKRFSELSHTLGELDNLKKKSDMLTELISDTCDKHLVVAHYDMITLEQHPTEFRLIEKYVNDLQYTSVNYKWVLRSLSLSLKHIARHPDYKDLLKSTISKAICVAEERRDDLGVLNLSALYWLTDPNSARKNIKKYVRLRKREGVDDGLMLYLKFIIYGMDINKDADKFVKAYYDNIDKMYTETPSRFKTFLNVLLHPIKNIRESRIFQQAVNLSDDDPMFVYFDALIGFGLSVAMHEEIDAQSLFNAAAYFYRMNYEHEMTLAPFQDIVANLISLIKRFPPEMQGNLRKLASIYYVDEDNITIGEMSQLGVACLINSQYKDERAVEQSRLLLETEKKWYAAKHAVIAESLIRHGNTCLVFNREDEALKVFYEAYEILKENAPDSDQLSELCRSMLNLKVIGKDFSLLKEVRDTALSVYKTNGPQCRIIDAYLDRLIDIHARTFHYTDGIRFGDEVNQIHSYILKYLPDCISQIVQECLKEKSDKPEVERLNEVLKQKVYPDECKLVLTQELYDSLPGQKLIDFISEWVARAYRDKINNISELTCGQIDWLDIERSQFKKAVKKLFDKFDGAFLSKALFEDFNDGVLEEVIPQLLKGKLTRQGDNGYLKTAKEESRDEEILRHTLENTISRQIAEGKRKKTIYECGDLEQLLQKGWNVRKELHTATSALFGMAHGITSYPSEWHYAILQILVYKFIAINNVHIDFDYSPKFAEGLLALSKNAVYDVAQTARVYYYYVQGNICATGKEYEKAGEYFSKVISKGIKYKTNMNDVLSYSATRVIDVSKINACKKGGVQEFITYLFGKVRRCPKKITADIAQLLNTPPYSDDTPNEYGVPQGQVNLLQKIVNQTIELKNFNKLLSNSEIYKLFKAKTSRKRKCFAIILKKVLGIINNQTEPQ